MGCSVWKRLVPECGDGGNMVGFFLFFFIELYSFTINDFPYKCISILILIYN